MERHRRKDAMKQPNSQIYEDKMKLATSRYELVETRPTDKFTGKKYHFIGAGGVGMSGLARLLIRHAAIVSGSDQQASEVTDALCQDGARIEIGHHENNLCAETDTVVISAAVNEDNPELKLAREKGCRVLKYAEMLGELMNQYEGIAVAGTHGKSTTSGWLTHCLKNSGIDTNYIVGANIDQLGTSSGTGESRFFVAEACEYDRSFLNLTPRIACILNIEQDHLDYYRDEDDIVEAFSRFAHNTRPGGAVIANGEDPNVAKVIKKLDPDLHCETFGLDRSCNFYADNLSLEDGLYSFEVYRNGRLLGRAKISLPGQHNIYNALAVAAAAVNAGVAPSLALELLPFFTGVDRRLMLKGCFGGVMVLDDYAHHPTEIKASLLAMRQKYEPARIWCVFQPHQYSRTRFLLDDFAESFKLADVTIVPEIYFVRDSEQSKREVNARVLVDRIKTSGSDAVFIDGFGPICDYLKENVTAGDLVVTMGAGDIWKVADEYIQWLGRDS